MIKSEIPPSPISITQKTKTGPECKASERETLARKMAEFKAGGGKIKRLASGQLSTELEYGRNKVNG